VTDKELEHIAKSGALLHMEEGGDGGVTSSLLGSYTPGGMTPTPGGDRVRKQTNGLVH
jgi:hypothetical protein